MSNEKGRGFSPVSISHTCQLAPSSPLSGFQRRIGACSVLSALGSTRAWNLESNISRAFPCIRREIY